LQWFALFLIFVSHAPAGHDFYVSLLSEAEGGLVPSAELGTDESQGSDWRQPLGHDRCVRFTPALFLKPAANSIVWIPCCSRVLSRTGLRAKFGVNKFVVKPAPHVLAAYPDHVRHATFYGRLASAKFIINLDMNFTFDERV
jgi:hypothetical protein